MSSKDRPLVIDGFTFLNEFEILQLRLELLWDVVDKFVIVESDKTHSGEKKPFNFLALAESKLKKYQSKLVFHPVYLNLDGLNLAEKPTAYDPRSAHWRLENFQRNGIDQACRNFNPLDLLIISDVDEIPDPEVIKRLLSDQELLNRLPISLHQHFFYYKLKYLRKERWIGSIITTVGKSKLFSAQWHRDNRHVFPCLPAAGWHLSYFGGSKNIRTKIESFAHQEYNNAKFKSGEHIKRCLESGSDLFGRSIDIEDVSENFFPKYFSDTVALRRDFFW